MLKSVVNVEEVPGRVRVRLKVTLCCGHFAWHAKDRSKPVPRRKHCKQCAGDRPLWRHDHGA